MVEADTPNGEQLLTQEERKALIELSDLEVKFADADHELCKINVINGSEAAGQVDDTAI